MADDQQRGRRRPSRDFHMSSRDRAPASRRPREGDITEDQPESKIVKKERGAGDADRPSTSQVAQKSTTEAKPADTGRERENSNRRNRLEIVETKPKDVTSKSGTSGQKISLVSNYYRILKTPNWNIYQYHVDFDPQIELRYERSSILGEHRDLLGGFLYDGMVLFTTMKLPKDKTVLKGTSKKGLKYNMTIKFVGVNAANDMQTLRILNIILRKSMEGLKLKLVGRNFYDPVAKINIPEFRLQLWPGYETSIRQHEKDILLCAELAHKVMRTETLYDILMRATETTRDYRDEFRRNVLGMTVLTDYNNRTYRIEDVDFDSSPNETFEMKGKQISFVEYYEMKYKIRIRDPKQPMLICKSRERNFRRGEANVDDTVILIPELCRATGITDAMRNNFQLMRAMADHTRMYPDKRIERLQAFNRRLQSTPESMKTLKDWNMQLDKSLVHVTGRVIDPQRIVFSGNNKITTDQQADWTKCFRNVRLFTTASRGLERWSVIAPQRNGRDLRSFLDALSSAANGISMQINRPREVLIYDDRNHSYIQAMEECASKDPQLIMILVPNNNAERYATIKKKSCIDRAVPTQVITQRCATNRKGLMSIATKVAIQINCKLGYAPWMIDLPLSGLMTIGYDVAKCGKNRSKAFGALVATMDLKTNATFYSTVSEGNSNDVLANNLWPMMARALRQYRKEHNALPNRILFYRDGIGEGSLKQVYEYEVKEIVKKLEEEYKRCNSDKPPMFAYVIVTKALNTRFFNGNRNPPPGTVVDDIVTLPERYDFYLVSQSVRQGTVSPTCYNIVYSTMKLTPDQMQMLTYKMTHLYYNWSGTTRVPAVCQYAKKLATLVATSLHRLPSNHLEKKLFYL